MKLYKITTDDKYVGYDTFDSAVVVANNEEEARRAHEGNGHDLYWVQDINELKVELLGEATESFTKPQVIVASFNAG